MSTNSLYIGTLPFLEGASPDRHNKVPERYMVCDLSNMRHIIFIHRHVKKLWITIPHHLPRLLALLQSGRSRAPRRASAVQLARARAFCRVMLDRSRAQPEDGADLRQLQQLAGDDRPLWPPVQIR